MKKIKKRLGDTRLTTGGRAACWAVWEYKLRAGSNTSNRPSDEK